MYESRPVVSKYQLYNESYKNIFFVEVSCC